MPKIILNLAMSLDGYIADLNDQITWISGDGTNPKAKDIEAALQVFLQKIDFIMMGRKAYEVTKSFGALSNQFPAKKIFVLSHRDINDQDVTVVSGDVEKISGKLNGNIWIFGGSKMIKNFLDADLLTHLEIALIPTLIGDGIKLFLPNDQVSRWQLETTLVSNGIIVAKYKRKRS